jgi:diaminohydroxyphosphoribosylaminopyrimidine deaminase/5-amino-6-(5-phosphoribosylamino)uracil reductase
MNDLDHMRAALALARRGLGQTWPNPSVGCVIVKDARVLGRATTAPGGRPHAETQALAIAGTEARGATAYVTLEPCAHHGQTPPCAEALIAAGVARVVVATGDPDPRVSGRGVAMLREAGIEVTQGVLAAEAAEINQGFMLRTTQRRPLITLKIASTLDGRIATHEGESQWITGEAARREVHALRGRQDAVMVGVGTVMADNPDLTCRLAGIKPVPMVRVVADSHLRTGLLTRLVITARQSPVWLLCRDGADPARREAMQSLGVELIDVPASTAGVDLRAALAALAERGLTRVLVEGGGSLAAALLREDLVDQIAWFHAPSVMGGDGWPAAQAFGIARLADMPRFQRVAVREVGDDILSEYRRPEIRASQGIV